jgi:hypothetical protein
MLPKVVLLSVCLVLITCADIISHYIIHGKVKSPTFAITLYAAQDKMSFMLSVKKEQLSKPKFNQQLN